MKSNIAGMIFLLKGSLVKQLFLRWFLHSCILTETLFGMKPYSKAEEEMLAIFICASMQSVLQGVRKELNLLSYLT